MHNRETGTARSRSSLNVTIGVMFGLVIAFGMINQTMETYSHMFPFVPVESEPVSLTSRVSQHKCYVDPLSVESQTAVQTAESAYSQMVLECAAANEEALNACSVPRVIHFVWVTGSDFKFRHYLSVKSLADRLKPEAIFVHGREFPDASPYFKRVVSEFGAKLVRSRDVQHIHSRAVNVVEHKADVIRLESLFRFGGMYFDFDVFALGPIDTYMQAETAMPRENDYGLNNGIIFAKRCSRFLARWYEAYRTFDDKDWGGHSILVPKKLYDEDSTGMTITGDDVEADWPRTADMFFSKSRDRSFWDPIRLIHVYFRQYAEMGRLPEPDVLKLENNYGRIANLVLKGQEGY